MKFEQLLRIYWSRGFLYGGKTQSFNVNFKEFFDDKPGLKTKSINLFIKRFELQHFALPENNEKTFSSKFSLDRRKIINMYLSQIISINSNISASNKAINMKPSKLNLKLNEKIRVKEAILALIIKSANDVAVCLAENLAGTEANFAHKMNLYAKNQIETIQK